MNKATCVALCIAGIATVATILIAASRKKEKKHYAPAIVRSANVNEQLQEVSVSPSNEDTVTRVCEHYKTLSDFLLSPDQNTVLGNVSVRKLMDTNMVRPLTIDGKSAVKVSLGDILLVSRRPKRFTRKDEKISPQIYVAHHEASDSALIVIKVDDLHFTMYESEDDFVLVGPKMKDVDMAAFLELVLEKILLDWGVDV